MAATATFAYAYSSSAAAVGHAIDYSFSVKNVGLLTLFDIYVHSVYLEGRASNVTCVVDAASNSTLVGSSAGEVSGMMPYPDGGLVPGRSIECTARVGVLQSEVSGEITKTVSLQKRTCNAADLLIQAQIAIDLP